MKEDEPEAEEAEVDAEGQEPEVITKAKVRGKIYYRLSAGNLAASSARSLCATVKAAGNGCIAWEEGKPLPGTLNAGSRVASR